MNRMTDLKNTATSISEDVAKNLQEVADLLSEITPSDYGLLITSLRWHAKRTLDGEFQSDYEKWALEKSSHAL